MAALLGLCLGGCTSPRQFAGHWTVRKGDSYFETLVGRDRYPLTRAEMPRSAERFLEAQPRVADPASADGGSASIYLEFVALPVEFEPSCYLQTRHTRLSIWYLRRIEAARPEYLAKLRVAQPNTPARSSRTE